MKKFFSRLQNYFFRIKKPTNLILPRKEKKIYIFLHVAKSGGSSFWHSLVNSINSSKNSDKFAIADAYDRAIKEFGIPDFEAQNKAASLILKEFNCCVHENLVLHYHAEGNNLDNLFPKDLKPYYILLFRNAEKRIISAYKWHKIKKSIPSNFFENFLSQGHQIILTNVFSMEHGSLKLRTKQIKRLIPLTLEDYNNPKNSSRYKKLASSLNINCIKPSYFKETMTSEQSIQPNLPEKHETDFWKKINTLANNENRFNKYILNNAEDMV